MHELPSYATARDVKLPAESVAWPLEAADPWSRLRISDVHRGRICRLTASDDWRVVFLIINNLRTTIRCHEADRQLEPLSQRRRVCKSARGIHFPKSCRGRRDACMRSSNGGVRCPPRPSTGPGTI